MNGYLVILSSGPKVAIEHDEVAIVKEGIASGSVIQVRQGIINPSHIVSIVLDESRRVEAYEAFDMVTRSMTTKLRGPTALRDIFEKSKQVEQYLGHVPVKPQIHLPEKPRKGLRRG